MIATIMLAAAMAVDASDYYPGLPAASVVRLTPDDYYPGLPKVEEPEPPKNVPPPPVTPAAAPRRGYQAWSYEWHLARGETRQALIEHLAVQQPEHQAGAAFDRAWLSQLTMQEIIGLHSDAHNRRIRWEQTVRAGQRPPQATKQQKQEAKAAGRAAFGTRDGKHPGPLGSAIRGFFGDSRYSNCPNGRCPR